MSEFGKTLFGGSRFLFWCLGPLFLLCGLGCAIGSAFAFASQSWKPGVALLFLGVCGVCLFLALLDLRRFRWAARMVTGFVALSFVLYFVDTFYFEKQPLERPQSRSESTPWNAIVGFMVIGVPCLWFTLKGRFGTDGPANQSVEPTDTSVTDRADARAAPDVPVAHQ